MGPALRRGSRSALSQWRSDVPAIVEHIAYITLGDGTRWQVLNSDGDDWDEAATVAAIAVYLGQQS